MRSIVSLYGEWKMLEKQIGCLAEYQFDAQGRTAAEWKKLWQKANVTDVLSNGEPDAQKIAALLITKLRNQAEVQPFTHFFLV